MKITLTTKIVVYTILFLLFNHLGSTAQTYAFDYVKGFGTPHGSEDYGRVIKTDNSGNILVGGQYSHNLDLDPSTDTFYVRSVNSQNIYLAKYNNSGVLIWGKSFGGKGSRDIMGMDIDNNGNFYISGTFTDSTDFDPSPNTNIKVSAGQSDFYFAKFSANGDLIWVKTLGGTSYEETPKIQVDNANNLFLSGNILGTVDMDPSSGVSNLSSSTTNGNDRSFIARYDTSGNFIWAKRVGGYCLDFDLDASNNIVLTGWYSGTNNFDPAGANTSLTPIGSSDIFVTKYSASGVFAWVKSMGGSSTDEGRAVRWDNLGNIILLGILSTGDVDPSSATYTLTSVGGADVFLGKYDVNGAFTWAKSFGSSSSESATGLVIDNANNMYLTGMFYGSADFDASANSDIKTSMGETDVFITKYLSNGNYGWTANLQGLFIDYSAQITIDPSNNILSNGSFHRNMDFDPSSATFFRYAYYAKTSDYSFFVEKLSSSGTFLHAFSSDEPNGGATYGEKLAKDNQGNIILVGTFTGKVDFDPSASSFFLENVYGTSSTTDIFIAKYSVTGNLIWASALRGTSVWSPRYQKIVSSLALDSLNNIYITGTFRDSLDMDPSTSDYYLTPTGGAVADIFIAKYASNGTFQWANKIGGSTAESVYSLALYNNELLLTGQFGGTVDFDPSVSGTTNVTVANAGIFIAKYDWNGVFNWVKYSPITATSLKNVLKYDNAGNIYMAGMILGTMDFDFSAGTFNVSSSNASTQNAYIAKFNNSGALLWAKKIGTSTNYIVDFDVFPNGTILVAGSYINTLDLDPSASGTFNITAISGGNGMYLAKYSSSGDFIDGKNITGTGGLYINSLYMKGNQSVALCGRYLSNNVDFDPSTNTAFLGAVPFIQNSFIAEYDSSMNFLRGIGIPLVSTFNDVVVDNANGTLVSGGFTISSSNQPVTISFNPLNSNGDLQTLNNAKGFLVRYNNAFSLAANDIKLNITPHADKIQVTWEVETTENVHHFEIERSTDGIEFKNIYTQLVSHPMNTKQVFHAMDAQEHSESRYFYRVRQLNQDNSIFYSNVESVEIKNEFAALIFPNPMTDKLTLYLNNPTNKIEVTDATGRVLFSKLQPNTSIEIDTSNWPSGTYFVTSEYKSQKQTQKVIKW